MKEKKRDDYFDNAKVLLIFFVVFGHFLEKSLGAMDSIDALYKWIYAFHMPTFVFISGYFSTKFFINENYMALFKKLLIPYLIFQCLYLFPVIMVLPEIHFSLAQPIWLMWFLMSMPLWYIAVGVLRKVKHGFLISIAISVFIAIMPEVQRDFSLFRTLSFLPFFYAGFLLKKDYILKLKQKWIKLISALFLVLLFVTLYVFHLYQVEWLYSASASEISNGDLIYTLLTRMAVIVTFVLGTCSFLSLVPRKKLFFSTIGKHTMYIYLLHGFIVQALFYFFPHIFFILDIEQFILILFLSIFLVWLLSSAFVRKATKILIEPT